MTTATHQERLGALRSVLDAWGYSDATSERFPIWIPDDNSLAIRINEPTVLHADLVAFTHNQQRDMSTSAILAQVVDTRSDITNRWIPAALALGAPAVLTATPDELTLWSTATEPSFAVEVATVSVSSPSALINHASAITPDVVARAKSIGFNPTLFPLGLHLLDTSRRSARSVLKDEVERTIERFTASRTTARNDITARLVVGALAVLMVSDKSQTTAYTELRPGALVDIAQHSYPGYFQWLNELTLAEAEAFDLIVAQLRTNINFASLEPAMVSDVYEQALVNKLVRREQGTFYTPPNLARQMVQAIPFEQVEPERRNILDPACGSGTMLLAAASRLTALQPDPADISSCHRYLISHLRGFDDDSLASEITKLCLLMSAMPIGNSWDVRKIDTLQLNLPHNDKPTIMISNPPWKLQRNPGNSAQERANRFLEWMVDNLADGGFLACVVPLSWITKPVSKSSRSKLLANAELLDVWRLPSSVFNSTSSAIAPAVLIAQKHNPGYKRSLCLVKTIRDTFIDDFLATGMASDSYLVEPAADGSRLTVGPLTRAGSSPTFEQLSSASEVNIGRPKRSNRPPRSRDEATHLELGSLRSLKAFARPTPSDLVPVRYPEDYSRSRATDEVVKAHKVIVTGKNFSTTDPYRLRVGFDDYGLSLREMFFSVAPNPQWPPWSHLDDWQRMCVVMAALGSGFGSCWVDENEPTRNVSIDVIRRFPIPTKKAALNRLAGAGNSIVTAVMSGSSETLIAASNEIEDAACFAYELSKEAQDILFRRLEGAPAGEGIVRYPTRRSIRDEEREDPTEGMDSFGNVLEANEDGLMIWIAGWTDLAGVRINAPLQMPGWFCRNGADFVISGNFHDSDRATFSFHRADWLTHEELASHPGPML